MDRASASGIADSTDDNRFDPQGRVSRAQAAVFLHRFLTLADLPSEVTPEPRPGESQLLQEEAGAATLLYMGQGSLRIVTAEGKVIYIDPFSDDGQAGEPPPVNGGSHDLIDPIVAVPQVVVELKVMPLLAPQWDGL